MYDLSVYSFFFSLCYSYHRYLHRLTHAYPPRLSAVLRKRSTASPRRADGAVRALRAVVNYLRAERDLDLPDVARKINAANGWGKVARRRRALTGEALPEFVAAVRGLGDDLPNRTSTRLNSSH